MNKKNIQKNTFLIFISLLVSFTFLLTVSVIRAEDDPFHFDRSIRVTMVNQEPDPVEAGQYVTFRVKVENYGDKNTGEIVVGIKPAFPFTLLPGYDLEKNIGSMRARQIAHDTQIVEWKLLVSKNAAEGLNNITVYYSNGLYPGTRVIYKDAFSLNVRTSDSIVAVKNIITPSQITPGAEGTVIFTLENLGDSFVKDVSVKLGIDSLGIATIGSTSEQIIQQLDGRSTLQVPFIIRANGNLPVGVYPIPVYISYKDNMNTKYTLNSSFGLVISSPISYLVAVDSSAVTAVNQNGEVTIKISNNGLTNLKLMTAQLKPSPGYDIISNPSIYIGKLDSDDFETVSYTIYTKKADDNKQVMLRLLLTYRDAFNTEYVNEQDVPLQLYSNSDAQRFGLTKASSPIGIIILIVVIIGAGIWYWLGRKKKLESKK